MIPHLQTICDFENGDCYRVCIACILELPVDQVPNFCANRAENWRERTEEYLKVRGLGLIVVSVNADLLSKPWWPRAWCVLSGPSPRDNRYRHAVVGKGGRVVHDPYPVVGDRRDIIPDECDFFICLDPSKRGTNGN